MELFESTIKNIDNKIKKSFCDVNNTLEKSMFYSLNAGGKRLRPMLIQGATYALSENVEKSIDYAFAVECIHTYSLIHDDLPAMDNADLRRGVPTNHKKFGDGVAILSGDSLLTEAFGIISKMNVSAKGKCETISLLASCAGSTGMCLGQLMDLEMKDKKLSLEELIKLSSLKTGALIKASVIGPCYLFEKTQHIKNLERYAESIGIAFQMTDDILDVIGDEKTTGKKVGVDKNNGKLTFVEKLGLTKTREKINELYDISLNSLKPFGEKGKYLAQIAHKIIERNK